MAHATVAAKRDDKHHDDKHHDDKHHDDKHHDDKHHKDNDTRRDKNIVGKLPEKLAEKRRALGRGLESLLPGPRAVAPPAPTLPQSARKDGAPSADPGPGASSPSTSLSPPSAAPLSPSAASASASSSSNAFTDAGFSSSVSLDSVSTPGARGGMPAAPSAPASSAVVGTLQASAAGGAADAGAMLLDIDQIDQNPYQTRTEFEEKALTDLAGSIQTQGVLQPIVVRPSPRFAVRADGKERFVLILGERRFRASKLIGKTTIPAIVKRVSEQQAAEMTLVENLQRQDLDCLDQAQAFAKLSTQFGLTQEVIGKRVGVSREQVSNYLRLLNLPEFVQAALRSKKLSYSHARLLLSLKDEGSITKVAQTVIEKKMSVALLEQLVMASHMPKEDSDDSPVSVARWQDPNVRAAQRSLEVVLGMRVRIRDRKGKGKITIEYGTLEDFDRVVGMLRGK